MKKVTKEEVERAVSTWMDFDGGHIPSMRAALEEFVANREKEEASEPTPAERVTVGRVVGDGSFSLPRYYVDDKVATDEQIKAALIAQLEKESHD